MRHAVRPVRFLTGQNFHRFLEEGGDRYERAHYPGLPEPDREAELASLRNDAASWRDWLESRRAYDVPPLEFENAAANFALDVAEGGPQLVGAAIAGALAGPPGATAFMSAQIYGGQYLDLTADGIDSEMASKAAIFNTVVSTPLEYIKLDRLFRIFNPKNSIGKIARDTGKSMTANVVTEALQGLPEEAMNKWARGENLTVEDALKALAQGAYEGLTLAPYSILGGAAAVNRTTREEKRAARWRARQQDLYNQAQALLPDHGGDKEALESVLLAISPEMNQVVALPFSGLEAAARDGVDLIEPLGLREELKSAESDRVFFFTAAALQTRLNPAQFAAAMEVVRRSITADSHTEAARKNQQSLAELSKLFAAEEAALDEALASGQANFNAQVVDSFFQTAMETAPAEAEALMAAFLDELGLTRDQWTEAAADGWDMEVDLDAISQEMSGNALWEGLTALARTEAGPGERAAQDAALDELGAPPRILERAGDDISVRTKADLVKSLRAAGRTADQAKRETVILCRFASIRSRITGEDPNQMLKDMLRLGRDAKDGTTRYFQPSLEDVRTADEALARDAAAWGVTVDKFLDGTISQRHQHTLLNQTPLVLQMLGVKNLPVVTTYNIINKILVAKHKLPADVVKQLPTAMADPIMIFKSATEAGDLVMMLELKDQDGATVVVPIMLESKGFGSYSVNSVKSVYGQKNSETLRPNNHWFVNQINQGNLLYRNNKKCREWSHSSGLQLPGVGANHHGKTKIANYDDLVKLREANPTLYQGADEKPHVSEKVQAGLAEAGGPAENPNLMVKDMLRLGLDAKDGTTRYFQPSLEEVRTADEALARDAAAWGKSVDGFIEGSLLQRGPVTMLSQTPLVLQMLGAKNLPITTSYGTLKKILVDKHKLPPEVVKQVPTAMTDPIMIFKSATQGGDLVMMLELKDQDGATVVVPVALEEEAGKGYSINVVKSIYSKNSNKWFADQIEQDNLLYRNNKKSREWFVSAGLQLPRGVASTHSRTKIANYDDLVKLREANPTLYQGAESGTRTIASLSHDQTEGQRRKFDESPTAELTGTEIFELVEPLNISEARNQALAWAKENGLYREDYENTDTGWKDIAVRKKGVEDSLRHSAGPEKIQSVAALPTFIREGVFLETTPAHNEKQKGMKSHVFAAKVNIAGKPMVVGFVIKEDANGKRFYDHELTEMKSLDEVVSHSGALSTEAEKQRSQPRQGSVINIVQKHLGVKPDMAFEQPGNNRDRPKGPRGRMELLSDGSINIIFGQSQDASTAVHEFAHAFRELVSQTLALPADRIADQAAFDSLKKGWADIEAWLGRFDDAETLKAEYDLYQKEIYGGRPFADLTPEERTAVRQRAEHEYFARGFEAYLMEGTAPTSGLKKLFSQMKTLLTAIYNRARGLNVELNDDVRQFFDSLLASEEEIQAESWRGESAFTPEELGELRAVDPALADQVMTAGARAREEAVKQITAARMKEHRRLRSQWKKEASAEARADARISRIEEIIARGGISRGSLLAGGYDDVKIKELNTRRRGLVTENGTLGYDLLAEEYGFGGEAEAFLDDMLATPTIAQYEEAYLNEREAEFAEYFNLEAGITDAEIHAYEEEHKLWLKYMGEQYRPGSVQSLRAAVKAQADAVSVDELVRLNQREWKERLKEAGRKARAAAGEARREERARALEQRLEMALRYKEQTDRVREVSLFEARARRLMRQKTADKATRRGGILPVYHEQIKNILADAGFSSKHTPTAESLNDFLLREAADGASIEVDQQIINGTIWQKNAANGETRRRTYRSLNYGEFTALKDAIDNLVFLGQRGQQVRFEGKLTGEKEVAGNILKAINDNNLVNEPRTPEQIVRERETGKKENWFKKWIRQNAGIMPSVRKAQALAYELDGQKLNGYIQRALYQPINQAHNNAVRLTEQWMNDLKKAVESTVGIDGYKGWAGEMVTVPGYDHSVRKSTIIAALLNAGNTQNLKALRNHQTFSGHLEAMFGTLNKNELAYVQAVWDFFDNTVYPELAKLTLRTKGTRLPKVEASPISIKLADGETVDLRGGYYPLVFDRELSTSRVIDKHLRAEDIKNLPGLYSPSEVHSSATIKRVGADYKGLTPDLNLAVMIGKLNENIQDLAYREAVNDVWRLIKKPEIKAAFDGVFGEDAWPQMKYWLRNLTRGGSSPNEMRSFDRKVRWVRNNSSVAAMGAKISVLAVQFTGIAQSAQLLGWGWTLQGIKDTCMKSPAEIKAAVDGMYKKSPQLRMRNQRPFDRDMRDSLTKGKDPLFKTWFDKWGEYLFKYIGMTDQMTCNAVWMGAYQKALHEGKNEAEAITDADATISLTQAMGENKDMNYAQQGWAYGELGKAATMFQTYFSNTINLIWLANRQAARQKRAKNYGQALGGLLRANWNLAVVPAIFSTLMWGGADWPDDEEEIEALAQRFARDIIGNLTGGLPLIRDAIGGITDAALGAGEPRFAASPIEGAVVGGYRAGEAGLKLLTGEEDKLRNTGRVLRGLGPFVPGLPASQIATTLEGIENWDDNEGFDKFYRLLIREPAK